MNEYLETNGSLSFRNLKATNSVAIPSGPAPTVGGMPLTNRYLYYDTTRNTLAVSGLDGNFTYAFNKVQADGLYKGINYVPAWNEITGKPTLFNGAYADLTGKPVLFSGSYDDLTSKPTLFDGTYDALTGKPILFSGDYNDLTNKPDIVTPEELEEEVLRATNAEAALQSKTDTGLATTSKTIVGAINELKAIVEVPVEQAFKIKTTGIKSSNDKSTPNSIIVPELIKCDLSYFRAHRGPMITLFGSVSDTTQVSVQVNNATGEVIFHTPFDNYEELLWFEYLEGNTIIPIGANNYVNAGYVMNGYFVSAGGGEPEPEPEPEPEEFTDKFKFTLAQPRTTSAGIYDEEGVLRRTLWSGTSYPAGQHVEIWDGKDDFGTDISNEGTFTPKVLSHNITYDWAGVWMNSSTDQTGKYVHKTLDYMIGIRMFNDPANKPMAIIATGYGEGEPAEVMVYLDNPQKALTLKEDYARNQLITHVAANSTNIFRAADDPYKTDVNNTFVYATDRSGQNFTAFSAGVVAEVTLGTTYNNAIGYLSNSGKDSAKITGLTANDTHVVIARSQINRLSVLNATTGALRQNHTIAGVRSVCIIGTDLWYATGATTVIKRPINADGTLGTIALTINGFSSVLDINYFGSNITVVDGGSSQQLKTYNQSTGALVWTRGVAGGYANPNNKEVFNDKFLFATITSNDFGEFFTNERASIAFETDGSYWVCDPGNQRIQHFAANGTYINNIAVQPKTYQIWLDANNDKHILSGRLVIEVDPTKVPQQGWKLKYNFQSVSDNNHVLIEDFVTLSNGRMYGIRLNPTLDRKVIVELNPTTGIRDTKVVVPQYRLDKLYEDGSIKWVTDTDTGVAYGKQTWFKKVLTGFDSDNDPVYGPDIQEDEINIPLEGPQAYSPQSREHSRRSANGNLIVYDSHVRPKDAPNQYRLGGFKNGKWKWRSMRTVEANHDGDYPTNGEMDWANWYRDPVTNSATGYHGTKPMTYEGHVFAAVHGEFWKNGQLNKYVHYHEDGLYIGTAGEQRQQGDIRGAIPFMAGNALTANLHYYNEDSSLNIIHGDENTHQGVHRIKILNKDSVQIQEALPTNLALPVLEGLDLLSDFKRGDVVTSSKGRWTFPNTFDTDYFNRFTVKVGSLTTDRHRLAGVDIRFVYAVIPEELKINASCDLGNYTNLNTWKVKGLINFHENERSAPEGTAGQIMEILDADGKVIADFFYERDQVEYSRTNFKGNGQLIKTYLEESNGADRDPDYDKTQHFQDFEIGATSTGVSFKYADFPVLTAPLKDSTANWRSPKTLRIRFYTIYTSYVRTIALYKLRLHTT